MTPRAALLVALALLGAGAPPRLALGADAESAPPPAPEGPWAATHPGILAAPGLLRSSSALPSGHVLSLALSGALFSGSDFIYPGSSDTWVGGTLAAGMAPLDYLDAFLALSSGRNANDRGTPQVLSAGTDLRLGARLRHGFGPLHLAAVGELLWTSPISGESRGGSGFGGAAQAVGSLFIPATPAVPVVLHANLGFRREAGSDLLGSRVGALATFAQGYSQWSTVNVAAAAEVRVGPVYPFLEDALEVPVGSEAPFSAYPSRLVPGIGAQLGYGFEVLAGLEVGLASRLFDGIPATPPWTARLGISYSGLKSRAPPPAPPPAPEPVAAPPPPEESIAIVKHVPMTGTLHGTVSDLEGRPLQAVISLPGAPGSLGAKVYDASPSYEIELPAGVYHAEAIAEGFLVRGGTFTIEAGQATRGDFQLRPVPNVKAVLLTREQVEIHRSILFAFNEARLLPESYSILDEVIDTLLRNSQVRKVRIEGHTDDVGTLEANQALSENRAVAVRDYLVQKGITEDRLMVQGFGKTRPLVDSRTETARAKNRRVQFFIIEQ
ncbi:MAG: OmpA family protein [Deltaproteobacteria bacterium]|nr:OmpA family protein [Deltaproteobacteria bacterium]